MADSQGDAYVRRDVFEARMDRMEMLLEGTALKIKSYVDKSTGETKAYVEKALTEIKTEVQKTGNDVKLLTTQVDILGNKLFWGINMFVILVSLAVLISRVIVSIRQPSLTREEIQKIVRAEIAKQSGGK